MQKGARRARTESASYCTSEPSAGAPSAAPAVGAPTAPPPAAAAPLKLVRLAAGRGSRPTQAAALSTGRRTLAMLG